MIVLVPLRGFLFIYDIDVNVIECESNVLVPLRGFLFIYNIMYLIMHECVNSSRPP